MLRPLSNTRAGSRGNPPDSRVTGVLTRSSDAPCCTLAAGGATGVDDTLGTGVGGTPGTGVSGAPGSAFGAGAMLGAGGAGLSGPRLAAAVPRRILSNARI